MSLKLTVATESLRFAEPFRISGHCWEAADVVYVTLSETGMIYYLTTAKVLRPDVAKYFDVPNMATAGYTVEADVAGLPSGKYLVGLAYPSNGAILRCPQFAYPVEVEAH